MENNIRLKKTQNKLFDAECNEKMYMEILTSKTDV